MASLFQREVNNARIPDAGAGAGVLAVVAVETLIQKKANLESIEVTAFENDELVLPHLENALAFYETIYAQANISFEAKLRCEDFVTAGLDALATNGSSSFSAVSCIAINAFLTKSCFLPKH